MLERRLSIILGVLNEEENIDKLLNKLDEIIHLHSLYQIDEIVIVDDGSKDKTKDLINSYDNSPHPFNIVLVERTKKMGMVNANIEGVRHAKNDYVLIMDSDLQHPVETIPDLISTLSDNLDLVIASRYVTGGGSNWSPIRGIISRGAVFFAHVFIANSRSIKDPISGYFLTRSKYFKNLEPHKDFYKMALYIISSNFKINVAEVPFTMLDRINGSSKIVNKRLSFLTNYLIELLFYWRFRNFCISKKRNSESDYITHY